MHNKIGFWLVFLISLVLFIAPISVGGRDEFGLDKVVHGGLFGLLTFLSLRSFETKKIHSTVLLIAYAFAIEYIQGRYLPLRHFDWRDITADLTGIALGLIVFVLFVQRKKSPTA